MQAPAVRTGVTQRAPPLPECQDRPDQTDVRRIKQEDQLAAHPTMYWMPHAKSDTFVAQLDELNNAWHALFARPSDTHAY